MNVKQWAENNGYAVAKELDDGRLVALVPLIMGTWRLVVGNEFTLDDGW